jgi:SAM-dependent methyltransferase
VERDPVAGNPFAGCPDSSQAGSALIKHRNRVRIGVSVDGLVNPNMIGGANMPNRVEILRDGIARTDKAIEIGPSFNPLVPKSEGWNSRSIDHLDRNGLIEKYRHDPSVNPAMIEAVDFVWTGGALSDVVPVEHHGTFDVVLASHVIEHVPDLIGFFQSAEILARSNGRMVLAVPDKRVCFDFFRPLSTTGDFLTAHRERRSIHSEKTLWDHLAYQATKHGNPGWGRADQEPAFFAYTLGQAAGMIRNCRSGHYIDAHAWVFVPDSFELIMLELARLGLTDWQIERKEAAEYTEFYVWLRRGGLARAAAMPEGELAAERMRLLVETMLDIDDQARQLPQSRASTIIGELAAETQAVISLRQAEAESDIQLKRMKEELVRAQKIIATVRSSRAWQLRSLLRRTFRLPATQADE